jgi:hypothetical protein
MRQAYPSDPIVTLKLLQDLMFKAQYMLRDSRLFDFDSYLTFQQVVKRAIQSAYTPSQLHPY